MPDATHVAQELEDYPTLETILEAPSGSTCASESSQLKQRLRDTEDRYKESEQLLEKSAASLYRAVQQNKVLAADLERRKKTMDKQQQEIDALKKGKNVTDAWGNGFFGYCGTQAYSTGGSDMVQSRVSQYTVLDESIDPTATLKDLQISQLKKMLEAEQANGEKVSQHILKENEDLKDRIRELESLSRHPVEDDGGVKLKLQKIEMEHIRKQLRDAEGVLESMKQEQASKQSKSSYNVRDSPDGSLPTPTGTSRKIRTVVDEEEFLRQERNEDAFRRVSEEVVRLRDELSRSEEKYAEMEALHAQAEQSYGTAERNVTEHSQMKREVLMEGRTLGDKKDLGEIEAHPNAHSRRKDAIVEDTLDAWKHVVRGQENTIHLLELEVVELSELLTQQSAGKDVAPKQQESRAIDTRELLDRADTGKQNPIWDMSRDLEIAMEKVALLESQIAEKDKEAELQRKRGEDRVAAMQQLLDARDIKLDDLTRELDAAVASSAQLECQLNEAGLQRDATDEGLEVARMRELVVQKEAEMQELSRELHTASERTTLLERELTEIALRKRVVHDNDVVTSTTRVVSDVTREFNAEPSSLELQLAAIAEEAEVHKQLAEDKDEKLTELLDMLDDKDSKLHDISSKLAGALEKSVLLELQLTEKNEEVARHKEAQEDCEQENSNLQDLLLGLSRELDAATAKASSLELELADGERKTGEEQEQKVTELLDLLDDKDSKLQEISSNLDRALEQSTHLERQLTQKTEEVEASKQWNKDNELNTSEMHELLGNKDSLLRDLTRELDVSVEKTAQLERELAEKNEEVKLCKQGVSATRGLSRDGEMLGGIAHDLDATERTAVLEQLLADKTEELERQQRQTEEKTMELRGMLDFRNTKFEEISRELDEATQKAASLERQVAEKSQIERHEAGIASGVNADEIQGMLDDITHKLDVAVETSAHLERQLTAKSNEIDFLKRKEQENGEKTAHLQEALSTKEAELRQVTCELGSVKEISSVLESQLTAKSDASLFATRAATDQDIDGELKGSKARSEDPEMRAMTQELQAALAKSSALEHQLGERNELRQQVVDENELHAAKLQELLDYRDTKLHDLTRELDAATQRAALLDHRLAEYSQEVEEHRQVGEDWELKATEMQELLDNKHVNMHDIRRELEAAADTSVLLQSQLAEKSEEVKELMKVNSALERQQKESHMLFENSSRRARELHRMVTSESEIKTALVDEVETLKEKVVISQSESELLWAKLDASDALALEAEGKVLEAEQRFHEMEERLAITEALFDEKCASEERLGLRVMQNEECTVCSGATAPTQFHQMQVQSLASVDEGNELEYMRRQIEELTQSAAEFRSACEADLLAGEAERIRSEELFNESLMAAHEEVAKAELYGRNLLAEYNELRNQIPEHKREVDLQVSQESSNDSMGARTRRSLVLKKLDLANAQIASLREACTAAEAVGRESLAEVARRALDEISSARPSITTDNEGLLPSEDTLPATNTEVAEVKRQNARPSPDEAALRRDNWQLNVEMQEMRKVMDQLQRNEVMLRTEIITHKKRLSGYEDGAGNLTAAREDMDCKARLDEANGELEHTSKLVQLWKDKALAAEQRAMSLSHMLFSAASSQDGKVNATDDAYIDDYDSVTERRYSAPDQMQEVSLAAKCRRETLKRVHRKHVMDSRVKKMKFRRKLSRSQGEDIPDEEAVSSFPSESRTTPWR